ncbi:MAG: LamB/YcsF family protein [Candidatus Gastranaerophilales bacterium]|nr:LamB/YcsF family protein [Candidatus Gastranaerophilales bacterium]
MAQISPEKTQELFIDINCDLAQSYGIYKNDLEFELLPYVSSASISCGLHSGDPLTIKKAVERALEYNLSIGAHIGYPDIQGFGYREMQLSDEEIQAIVLYQIGALSAIAKSYDVQVDFIRPHGTLYKQIATDYSIALNVAKAIAKYCPWIVLVGASGEILEKAGEEANIKVAHEIHLDKSYNPDGSIDFNSDDIISEKYAIEMLSMLKTNSMVKNNAGGITKVRFNTIHLNTKSQISFDIAKKTKEFFANPVPITVSILKDANWI